VLRTAIADAGMVLVIRPVRGDGDRRRCDTSPEITLARFPWLVIAGKTLTG
jgi:hypothetical protein